MKWSPQQDAALRSIDAWLRDPSGEQVYKLFGYAGTGKTTIIRHAVEAVDGDVLYAAFTGKAAHVMRAMGCANATTIHSLIYHTKDRGRARLATLENELMELVQEVRVEARRDYDGDEPPDSILDDHPGVQTLRRDIEEERGNLAQPFFTLNPDSDVRGADVVVIDECSMVDHRLGEDLLSFGTKVLVIGDPAQLPPVRGDGFFLEGRDPDVVLTEIHRQARDNPIIRLASEVREGRSPELGTYGDSSVISVGDIDRDMILQTDQILVGRNKTRHSYNDRVRELLDRGEDYPVAGDKLVCLRNNHDAGLLNGAIWHAVDIGEVGEDRVIMTIRSETDPVDQIVEAHLQHFQGREDKLAWWERKEAEEFTYGYALTVHKAQGSQWPHVVLFDESFCFRADKFRWLYTGITRAAETVTVVRM